MDVTTRMNFSDVTSFGNTEGKNSLVFLAHDRQLDCDFIMKVVPKCEIYKDYNSEDEDNLFNESKILYKIEHPNIMKIQHASYDEHNICFVMPICKNGSLNSLIEEKYLSAREIIKYSLEFLSGLHFIHTKNLIHFDIKPTNILIDNNGKAILTDFGLAKFTDVYGFAKPNKIYQAHKPPEALDKYTLFTNLSDIYQSGVTMYRLCNGNNKYKQQFEKNTLPELETKIQKGLFPDRKSYLPHIPKKLRNIINKAMNINPDKRYQTVLEMMNKLSDITQNIDWEYKVFNDSEQWSKLNGKGTHVDQFVLQKTNNIYKLRCYKIRVSDNNKTNSAQYNEEFNSLDAAYKKIEYILENY